MRIFVADDEQELLKLLADAFKGQNDLVETASDGKTAMEIILDKPFDLIILDVMMPEMDGFEILKQLRRSGIETPVLILTAREGVSDRVKGLDLGADDYLPKPFSISELFARSRALLRRSGKGNNSEIAVGNIVVKPGSREVFKDGKLIEMTAKEFSILEFLFYNHNIVISRFNLAEHVWGDEFDPFTMSNFIDVHIKNIRKKLEDSSQDRVIHTVRGVGFVVKDNKVD